MDDCTLPDQSGSRFCTPIKRHVKVQGEANPYDPAYETYFEKREADHMRETRFGVLAPSLSLV